MSKLANATRPAKSLGQPLRAEGDKARPVDTGSTRIVLRSGEPLKEVRFGRVIVQAAIPTAAVAKRNINEGRSALSRAKSVLVRPGVKLSVLAGVPLYHADPAAPGLLVRTVDGRITRGRFIGGKFKPA